VKLLPVSTKVKKVQKEENGERPRITSQFTETRFGAIEKL